MARSRKAVVLALSATALSLGLPLALQAQASPITVSVQTLHFDVTVGPTNSTHCDIVADLYTPSTATAKHRAPAILTTNGFGGSKDDQAVQSMTFAKLGYVSLSYSGLGFGGSDCNIELDSPEWDGQAAKQLVDFLGGAKKADNGLAIHYVQLDKTAADGKHYAYDPRVGMIGGSYGGEVQFAAASVDPRIDTIIPLITWNDLSYSLAPNNTSTTTGVSYETPGVEKLLWTSFFVGDGIVNGVHHGVLNGDNKQYLAGCLNFDAKVCPAELQMDALGYPTPTTLAFAKQASVASYMSKIKIPTLLAQGEADSLFNLRESTATYAALKAQGTPVQLVWQSWGHSNGTPAPGELDFTNLSNNYEGKLFASWFAYYLKGQGPKPSLGFSYFRPWVSYTGSAAPAYGTSASYPAGNASILNLSGNGALTSDPSSVTSGTSTFVGLPAGVPTSVSEIQALNNDLPVKPPALDLPGTFASWETPTLTKDTDVAGIPSLTATITAIPGSTLSATGALAMPVVFAKLYDIAPDGSKTLNQGLVSAARIDSSNKGPITIALPGIVHQFAKGHRMELVLSSGDVSFRSNDLPEVLQVSVSKTQPATLSIPVV